MSGQLHQQQEHHNKEKPHKLRLNKSDRNANSTLGSADVGDTATGEVEERDHAVSTSTMHGTKPKSNIKQVLQPKSENINNTPHKRSKQNAGPAGYSNYMELDFCEQNQSFLTAAATTEGGTQFTELFCDFPVSYAVTNVVTGTNQYGMNKPSSPYQDPAPPTPPPLSQIPSRESRLLAQSFAAAGVSISAPNTPSRGKVVLSKKERKELGKQLSKQQQNGAELFGPLVSAQNISVSAQSSPYRGRVTELKNCIAKINSRGIFASLHRNSQKSLQTVAPLDETPPSSNEVSPPPPAPESIPSLGATQTVIPSNNNDNDTADYSEKLKNLPVRQRKAATSHMDNYCLFDPVDFINEKAMRYRNQGGTTLTTSAQVHGLRDPLFSSSQHLVFDEEEMVPEVIYDEQESENEEEEEEETIIIETSEPPEVETEATASFDHHNYFVIDPDDFEEEPMHDIGIPNPFTNDQVINANLAVTLAAQENQLLHTSPSLEKLLKAFETAPSMSNSQESKDTNTTNSTTETTSTALVESSTSTNSTSSQSSSQATKSSTQNTLQRTKKKLTFLNLSPFRSPKHSEPKSERLCARNNNNANDRAMSELVSEVHLLHLQNMLMDASNRDKDMRARTVPIESNYVLFNPGPVPSRNVQYKIRKPRPLSTHSDADSGFLSPCSPDDQRSNPAILVLQQCDSVQGYIEIYTDWANYYLERAKSKKKVTDLSSDCRDGLLLADVIEAVTSFKVPDLVKKPKNQQHMYDNVNSCLNVLRSQAVAGLDNIQTNDICTGRLKAVLALFFALSRFKQQAKQTKSIGVGVCGVGSGSVVGIGVGGSLRQPTVSVLDRNHQQQELNTATNANVVVVTTNSTTTQTTGGTISEQHQQHQQRQQHAQSIQNGNEMVNRQIPTAYSKANGGTAIPLPATVMVQRRCPPDKVRPLPPTPNHTPSIPGLGKNGSEFNTSRPNSPPTSNHTIQSLKSGNNNGLRPPTVKAASSGIPPPGSANVAATTSAPPHKHSMLDKLKLFNKEKQNPPNTATNKTQIQSKRTSSSSGFSSARSERSDSSLSLNDGHISQIKPPAVSVTANKAQKNNTKQSKLLAAQQKKDASKASKLDKNKERSPARSINKEDTGMDSRTSTLSRTAKNSLPRSIGEKNTLKTSSKLSLHSKSESKSSLIVPPTKILNSPNGTGLPKPIAAIKGTSKLPQPGDNKLRMSNSNSQHEMIKREKSDISRTNPPVNNISEQHQPTTPQSVIGAGATSAATQTPHIVKPVPIMPEPVGILSPYYANATTGPTNISQGNGVGGYMSEPSTPQHLQRLHQQTQHQMPIFGNRLPSKSGLLPPNSSRKLEYNAGPGILTPPQRSPMRQLNQSQSLHNGMPSPSGGPHNPNSAPPTPSASDSPNKYHTIPNTIGSTIYESQEEKPVSVLPMRPLLRGYNSHVTLPTRGARGQHQHQYISTNAAGTITTTDYCETDIGQGYCSDGDALRVSNGSRLHGNSVANATSRFHDIDNGYLSEGSSGIGLSPGCTSSLGGAHGKHFLSLMRARTQLPTTIEERIRNSRGSLDSICTAPPSSAASQDSSSGGSSSAVTVNNNKMDGNSSSSANVSPHHQHHHGQHRSSSRSGRDNWMKMTEPLNGHKADNKAEKSSPSRRSLGGSGAGASGSGSSSKQGSPSSRTKGVPPSFGYVKRANGGITSTAEQMMIGGHGNSMNMNGLPSGRTAHVSAVPRTGSGRKVAGGTQTLPNDMTKAPSNTQHRSFSLTGPTATQLSQSIRERLATGSHSLPKPGSDLNMFQHRIANRPGKLHDGSLSDTQTYAEVKPEYSSYAMWLKHSNTAGSRLSEGDSIENMQIGSPAMTRHGHKMIHNRSSGSGNAGGGGPHLMGAESPYVQSPRLNRSNSIRSTKSEKMYPSMLSRGPDVEIEPYYCLPVGTIDAAQSGIISAQMAAAAAAAAAHVSGASGGAQTQGGPNAAWSQPTSPTPINRGFGCPLSPTHGTGVLTMGGIASSAAVGLTGAGGHRLTYPKKNDDVHGSAASLLSGGSSLYGSAEERQAHEIRRLKRELMDAREQVLSLSSQLSTNAHVVSAFEQSLSNMTNRLQHLTATAERKDGELTDMRQTIELLRKQSIQAGLTTAHMQSMGVQTQSQNQNEILSNANGKPPTSLSHAMVAGRSGTMGHVNTAGIVATNGTGGVGAMQRHHSTDSMCSLNSISSGCSTADKKQKKKGWLRSSFTKAFSRNAKISKTSRHVGHHHSHHHLHGNGVEHGSPKANGHNQMEPAGLASLATQPAPPLPSSPTMKNNGSPAKTVTLIENAKPIDAIENEEHQMVEDLKKQLREKDLVLTDIRLEALSSASQLENLKETVNKMRAEMMSLKQNNERLQKMVTTRSLAGSEASLGNAISPNGSIGDSRRYSLADGNSRPPMELPKRLDEEVEEENIPPAPAPEPPQPPPPLSPSTHIDLTPPPPALEPINSPAHVPSTVEELPDVTDGKKIAIACYLGQPESFGKYCDEMFEVDDFYANSAVIASHEGKEPERKVFPNANLNEFVIAYTYISGKTTWQNLDYIVRKTFKDYAARIDPGTNLGLNTDSITSYHLGEAKRGPEMGFPELLPCGYIIGSVRTLYICLQGVGSLAFDSLIPRSIVHRYISLLTEHRRLILCGPSGTGKSYLARRLAEFLVARSGRGNPSETIATFNVDHKSSKDLRQYLSHIAEQAAIANGASELPSVIILDNLHHASALGDVFSSLLSAGPAAKLPCIIGTMSQATCNTTNLQLHHNFRWVLTANHMEPVKGFLGRFLRRRLFQLELQTQHPQPELSTVLAWLPTVWQHINRFLEVHSSSDVTIGPRLFLSCPLDLKDSQVWFTDIWNYHLSPYLVEAVREGVQLYGRRGGAWNDPSAFIRNSYPWPYGPDSVPPLRQINAEDVGLEGVATNNVDNQDPLLNMLMRLQEAANYSEHQDQESDCASLDSNITPDSSAGAE